jgi:hypothetical protein
MPQQTVSGRSTVKAATASLALRHPSKAAVEAVIAIDVHSGASLGDTMRGISSVLHQEAMRVHMSLVEIVSGFVVATSTATDEAELPETTCRAPDSRLISAAIQLRMVSEAKFST